MKDRPIVYKVRRPFYNCYNLRNHCSQPVKLIRSFKPLTVCQKAMSIVEHGHFLWNGIALLRVTNVFGNRKCDCSYFYVRSLHPRTPGSCTDTETNVISAPGIVLCVVLDKAARPAR